MKILSLPFMSHISHMASNREQWPLIGYIFDLGFNQHAQKLDVHAKF